MDRHIIGEGYGTVEFRMPVEDIDFKKLEVVLLEVVLLEVA